MTEKKTMKFIAPFRADVLTKNGRIYPKELLEKAMKAYNLKTSYVCLGDSENLENIIGAPKEIYINREGEVEIEVEMYETMPMTELLRNIPKENLILSVSGTGKLEKQKLGFFKRMWYYITKKEVSDVVTEYNIESTNLEMKRTDK